MSHLRPDPRLAAAFISFAARSARSLRKDSGEMALIHLLQYASEELRSLLLPRLSPKDYYVSNEGVGVHCESVRLLRAQFEALKTSEIPDASDVKPGEDDDFVPSTQPDSAFTKPHEAEPAPQTQAAPPVHRSIGQWKVCDPSLAEARIKDGRSKDDERSRLLTYLSKHPFRALPGVTRTKLKALEALIDDFPNFKPAIDEVLLHLRYRQATRMSIELPHLLLAGPPGIGKTEFARRLAVALDLHFELRSLADITASFAINGSHRTWGNAAPGLIAKMLVEAPSNQLPMILFDELDKVHDHGNHPPSTALLGLLERRTAECFRDEYLEFELNARPMAFVFTCNDLDRVNSAIRSRLKIIKVEAPTQAQMPAVVRSIDRALRDSNRAIGKLFHPLHDDVIARLGTANPRALSGLLTRIYGIALRESGPRKAKSRITPRIIDLVLHQEQRTTKPDFGFGFVPSIDSKKR